METHTDISSAMSSLIKLSLSKTDQVDEDTNFAIDIDSLDKPPDEFSETYGSSQSPVNAVKSIDDEIRSQLSDLPEDILNSIYSRLAKDKKDQTPNQLLSISDKRSSFASHRMSHASSFGSRRVSMTQTLPVKNENIVYSDSDSENEEKNNKTKLNRSKSFIDMRRRSTVQLIPGVVTKVEDEPNYLRRSVVRRDSNNNDNNDKRRTVIMSADELPPIIAPTRKDKSDYVYDIDSVGLGSFQVSSLYILQRRSLPASRNHVVAGKALQYQFSVV